MGLSAQAYISPVLPLPKWQAAVSAARNAVRPAKLVFFGDSNIVGEGTGTGSLALINARPNSMPQIATAKINSKISKATSDSFFGDQNVAQAAALTVAQYDTRLVLGTGWQSDASPSSVGGAFLVAPVASTTDLVFSPPDAFDRFTVFYPVTPTASTALTAKVDAVSVGTINQALANGYTSTTYSVALGTHTIGFANTVALKAYIGGLYCWNSAAPGIVTMQCSSCGGAASFFSGAINPWDNLPALGSLAPDLTIVYCTINDSVAGTAVATYQAQMDAIVAKAVATGDALIVGAFPANTAGTTNGLLDSYMGALNSIGAKYAVRVMDLRTTMGANWTIANSRGYVFDNNHPNTGGHAMIGGIIADAIYVP